MAVVTVNGMTAAAMIAIRNQTIVSAAVVANQLILTRYDGTTINAGSVVNMTWTNVSISEASTGPEASVTAKPGSLVLKTNGEHWLKATGTGNTGWVRSAMAGMAPFVICTTATRPANPVVGQRIWDTTVNQELQYYGATSGWMQPWDRGWGVVDDITNVADVTVSTATVTVLSTTSKTLRNDRKYKITWNGTLLSFAASGAMTVTFSFWRGTAASVVSLSLQLMGVTDQQIVGGSFTYTPASTATSVWNIRAINSLASGCSFKNASAPGVLTIEDIGPAGNPPSS